MLERPDQVPAERDFDHRKQLPVPEKVVRQGRRRVTHVFEGSESQPNRATQEQAVARIPHDKAACSDDHGHQFAGLLDGAGEGVRDQGRLR